MLDRYGHISDELLAAFLDGNTTREETEQVLGEMAVNDGMREVIISNQIITNIAII